MKSAKLSPVHHSRNAISTSRSVSSIKTTTEMKQPSMNYVFYGKAYDYSHPEQCLTSLTKNITDQKILSYRSTKPRQFTGKYIRMQELGNMDNMGEIIKSLEKGHSKSDLRNIIHKKSYEIVSDSYKKHDILCPMINLKSSEEILKGQKASSPLGILDKFEKVTDLAYNNARKIIAFDTRNDIKKNLIKKFFKRKTNQVDFIDYNEKCREKIPALNLDSNVHEKLIKLENILEIDSENVTFNHEIPNLMNTQQNNNQNENQITIVPQKKLEKQRSKSLPRIFPSTQNIPTNPSIIYDYSNSLIFNQVNTDQLKTENTISSIKSKTSNIKSENKSRSQKYTAEIREMFDMVSEKKIRTKEIANTCQKYKTELENKEFMSRQEKLVSEELAWKLLNENKKTKLPAKIVYEAIQELKAKDFNINKRYNIDNALIQKHREELARDLKKTEKALKCVDGDRFGSRWARVKTDFWISKMLYFKKKKKSVGGD